MRELLRAIFAKKRLVALMETDSRKGALTIEQARDRLKEATFQFDAWGLVEDMQRWGLSVPRASELFDRLFSTRAKPIEWNRIGVFQDVTLRLLANRALGKVEGETYVHNELAKHKPILLAPSAHHKHHVYCSPHK